MNLVKVYSVHQPCAAQIHAERGGGTFCWSGLRLPELGCGSGEAITLEYHQVRLRACLRVMTGLLLRTAAPSVMRC